MFLSKCQIQNQKSSCNAMFSPRGREQMSGTAPLLDIFSAMVVLKCTTLQVTVPLNQVTRER